MNEGSNTKKGKNLNMNKPVSVSRLPPSILAKLSKKINKFSKYSKKNIEKKDQIKLYAQTSSTNITRKTLEIKKIFPNLQNKKLKTFKKSSEV